MTMLTNDMEALRFTALPSATLVFLPQRPWQVTLKV